MAMFPGPEWIAILALLAGCWFMNKSLRSAMHRINLLKDDVESLKDEIRDLQGDLVDFLKDAGRVYEHARKGASRDVKKEYEDFKRDVVDEMGGFELGEQKTVMQKRGKA